MFPCTVTPEIGERQIAFLPKKRGGICSEIPNNDIVTLSRNYLFSALHEEKISCPVFLQSNWRKFKSTEIRGCLSVLNLLKTIQKVLLPHPKLPGSSGTGEQHH